MVLAALLAAALILPAASLAQETEAFTVNPSASPMTAEEVRAMTEDAREAFYQNSGLRDELASEIQTWSEVLPTANYEAEEREFYILTHEGKCMRFFMEIIGEPEPGFGLRLEDYVQRHRFFRQMTRRTNA